MCIRDRPWADCSLGSKAPEVHGTPLRIGFVGGQQCMILRMLWITVGRSGDKWCGLWITPSLIRTAPLVRGPHRYAPLEATRDVPGSVYPQSRCKRQVGDTIPVSVITRRWGGPDAGDRSMCDRLPDARMG